MNSLPSSLPPGTRRHALAVRRVAVAIVGAAAVALPATVTPAGADPASPPVAVMLSAARMHPVTGARRVRDHTAGRVLALSPGGRASIRLTASPSDALIVRARRAGCTHAARLALRLDGRVLGTRPVLGRRWTPYKFPGRVGAGAHRLDAFWPAHSRRGCANGLLIHRISLRARPAPSPTPVAGAPVGAGNPLAAEPPYRNPDTPAQRQVRAWSSSRPADAAQIEKIASRPTATWFASGWTSDVRGDASALVSAAADQHHLPVLVDYNLPNRDCGGYSAGGASSDVAYRAWTRDLAAGIGTRPAAVILEPDALAELDCLSATDRQSWIGLLADAVAVLSAHPNISVYIDAGNSNWQSVDTMAARLSQVNVAAARGFSLNVSNFRSTSDELAYGDQLSARLGAKHFVVDTSRNGAGPAAADQWCNPDGRALGPGPTTATGDTRADALLWIKAPGESDGTCNGGPAAGAWWADYALGLAQRAAY